MSTGTVKGPQPQKLAAAATLTAAADPKLSFLDPATITLILDTIIPAAGKLFAMFCNGGQTPTPTQLKTELDGAFHEDDGSYDEQAIGPVRHRAKVELKRRKLGLKPRDLRDGAERLAVHALNAARTAPDQDLQEELDWHSTP